MPEHSRYPLSWPQGWKRTAGAARLRAKFGSKLNASIGYRNLTLSEAVTRLQLELNRLGARGEVLSTNVVLRLDGLPRSGQSAPSDPGAAVYFNLKGQARCLACDRWLRVEDNVAAIAKHIEAIRAVDRYGVGTLDQAFAGYAQLQPAALEWWIVLGLPRTASHEQILEARRELAKQHHPDLGGDPGYMARINQAYEVARAEVLGR